MEAVPKVTMDYMYMNEEDEAGGELEKHKNPVFMTYNEKHEAMATWLAGKKGAQPWLTKLVLEELESWELWSVQAHIVQ